MAEPIFSKADYRVLDPVLDGWMKYGACVGSQLRPEAWDGIVVRKTGRRVIRDFSQAKAVCDSCPVRLTCLTDAIEYGETGGMRGAYTPDEYTAMAKAARKAA